MVKRSSSPLLLSELLLALAFFALAAAICLGVFAAARQDANRSADLSRAVREAQNAAECFRAAAGELPATAELWGGTPEGDALVRYFDAQWRPADAGADAAYTVRLSAAGADGNGLAIAEIIVYNGILSDAVLFRLESAALAGEAGA